MAEPGDDGELSLAVEKRRLTERRIVRAASEPQDVTLCTLCYTLLEGAEP